MRMWNVVLVAWSGTTAPPERTVPGEMLPGAAPVVVAASGA
ncbi:hypothetical protein [Micromonospora sp. NPDC051006]